MKYRLRQIVYVPLESDCEEEREFDGALRELVRDAFSDIAAPAGFMERLRDALKRLK